MISFSHEEQKITVNYLVNCNMCICMFFFLSRLVSKKVSVHFQIYRLTVFVIMKDVSHVT